MATYLSLVQKLWAFTEKIPYANTTAEQRALMLRHVNDAVRFVYNHGDLSFKTVIKRGFVYTVQTDPSAPGKGTPLPEDFMGFHQVGKVYLEDYPRRPALEYTPYLRMIELTEGPERDRRGIPTNYGLGGPSDAESAENQRELILWKTPPGDETLLTLVYQRTPPPDVDDIDQADVEIPRIPATWHIPVVLAMAKVFLKSDKGADAAAFSSALATAIKQMDTQEPHGREAPSRFPRNPFWRRGRLY